MQLPEQIYTDLKSQLPTLIEALKTGAEYGGELAHRFIVYDIVYRCIDMVLAGIWIFLTYKAFQWAYKNWKGTIYDNDLVVFAGAGLILLGLLVLIPIVGIDTDLANITKDIFIPELRIIEMIQGLTSTI